MLLQFRHKLHFYFTWWMFITSLEPSGILRFGPYTWPTTSHCCWLCLLPCSDVQRRPIGIQIFVQAEKFGGGRYSARVHFMMLVYHRIISIKSINIFLRRLKYVKNREDFNVSHWIATYKLQNCTQPQWSLLQTGWNLALLCAIAFDFRDHFLEVRHSIFFTADIGKCEGL
jgi:hypothetical protein